MNVQAGDSTTPAIVSRTLLSFYIRTFPGLNRLRHAVALIVGVDIEQVRGLMEDADPAIRLDARAFVKGFQAAVELYIDPKSRVWAISITLLALALSLGALRHPSSVRT